MTNPIAIVGGGIVGLSIAWHLAQSGQSVSLFEKETCGSQASSKAAGLLTPAWEVQYAEAQLLELYQFSLSLYSKFISDLEKDVPLKSDFQSKGSLLIAIDQDDEAELLRFIDFLGNYDCPLEVLSTQETLKKEKFLSKDFSLSAYAPHESFVDNLALIEILKKACLKNGVQIYEKSPVEAFDISHNQIKKIKVHQEWINVSQCILASGLNQKIEGYPAKISLRSVKGQALELFYSEKTILEHAIRTIHRYPVYMLPRSDGRLIIGASSEEKSDNKIEAGPLLDLLYGAWKILPYVYEMEFKRTWVGHRPTTMDHAPIIGPSETKGLYYALGLYRHGILMAPFVGKFMTDLIVKEEESKYSDLLSYKRFL